MFDALMRNALVRLEPAAPGGIERPRTEVVPTTIMLRWLGWLAAAFVLALAWQITRHAPPVGRLMAATAGLSMMLDHQDPKPVAVPTIALPAMLAFEPGAKGVGTEAQTTLAVIAAQIKGNGGVRVAIAGLVEPGANPQDVAHVRMRAITVRDELLVAGVPADRLFVRGIHTAPAGGERGDRVEIKVVD